jgi:rsbT antagonist protein RsbS
MRVPILKIGETLIASIQGALTDSDLEQLRDDLIDRVGRLRARGVVLDVTVLDVVDSFASRMLGTIAQSARLRGARTVIVGVQPEVAFAMVELGLSFHDIETALDLEEGLSLLQGPPPKEGHDAS